MALLTIVAGSQLYGVLGAFFAGPVADTLQAVLVALWSQWKKSHPEQVPHRQRREHEDGGNRASTTSRVHQSEHFHWEKYME